MISHNVTSKVEGFEEQTDWTLDNNVFVQDRFPSQAGYYDTVLLPPVGGDPTNLANFAYLPGGPLDGAKIGASNLILRLAAWQRGPYPASHSGGSRSAEYQSLPVRGAARHPARGRKR